jgi:hypothetical protein
LKICGRIINKRVVNSYGKKEELNDKKENTEAKEMKGIENW